MDPANTYQTQTSRIHSIYGNKVNPQENPWGRLRQVSYLGGLGSTPPQQGGHLGHLRYLWNISLPPAECPVHVLYNMYAPHARLRDVRANSTPRCPRKAS